VGIPRLSQKPGFWDFGFLRGESETGFLTKSWWGFLDCRRNPVSGIFGILGGELETGFLTKISVMMRKFW